MLWLRMQVRTCIAGMSFWTPTKLITIGLDGEDTILKRRPLTAEGDPTEPALRILETNLIGVAYTARLASFYFSKQPTQDHSLIITASLSSYIDHPFSPEYSASKWGARGLMRSLRSTGPAMGMRVNMIAPWYVFEISYRYGNVLIELLQVYQNEHFPRRDGEGLRSL